MIYVVMSIVIGSLVSAIVAINKSRSALVWGVAGFVFPLAALVAICVPPLKQLPQGAS